MRFEFTAVYWNFFDLEFFWTQLLFFESIALILNSKCHKIIKFKKSETPEVKKRFVLKFV